ncbi:MAG: hypothetical protein RL637_153 [Pseudomonadota bacterium]|jgi:aspartyl-tRNA(Asn)/glutamyl-tRNA(Gln) amidotransferase subunit A
MIYHQTLTELIKALRSKKISSVELTRLYLDRIHQHADLNAFITVTDTQALADAQRADQQLHQGNAPLLTGIPLAHKDLFCTQGIRTSCGSKMLDNFIAPYQATVVDKLANAGTVLLGKLNMDEFAMGSSNENSFYGAVANPWDQTKVAGGSSGGSAAAVAARLTPAATGTDTGGSIRQPAAFCGVSGLKPTYGRVSRYGMVAYASSLDQGGLFAQTAEDIAILLSVMAGFDAKDSTSVDCPVPDYHATLGNDLRGLKIGLPTVFFNANLNRDIGDCLQQALNEYQRAGAELIEIAMPMLEYAIPAYYVIACAECSANLARFDGVRYGYRCQHPQDLTDLYSRSRGEAFGTEVKRRILMGTYALSSGYYDAYYLKAQKVRRLIAEDFKQAFEQVDVIMAPVTPTTAFGIGEKVQDPIQMYLADIYTIAVNLAGLPAMSIPAGFVNQLPVGLQLIGNYFAESSLLNIAHAYQQRTNWHQLCPPAFR